MTCPSKFIKQALTGKPVFFKDIPDNCWDVFWELFEANEKLVLNDDDTGIVKLFKII